jgi:predicted DNA-binding transcriptional regulator AlpA
MALSQANEDEGLMTLAEVCKFTGRGRETIRRWRKRKLFPEPVCKLGPYPNSMLAWKRSAVLKCWRELPEKFPWIPPANDNTHSGGK